MDTVLGLALTPTTIGWVMADGSGVPGAPALSGDEVGVSRGDAGLDVSHLAASASALAARARTMLAAGGERLHGVAVTWSDEAAVGAALLLELLADAGFDHVVPVRFSQAAASLTAGIGLQRERTAVCVVEPGLATLVLLDDSDSADPIVTVSPIGGTDDVISWLVDTLGAGGQGPELLMVAGSMRGMDRLARRLESKLSVPVFVQGGAQQALARGAALALAPHSELTGPALEATVAGWESGDLGPRRAMSLSYAGALTMLAGGAVTLVASVSAALSLQLGTGRDAPHPQPPAHVTVARVAVPAAPPAAAPAQPPAAAPVPPDQMPGASEEPAEFGSLWDAPEANPDPPAPPQGRVPALLDRVREHLNGLPGR
ncbi:hypothetical protein [Mycolicibacter longobardus]|uniref:DUF7159 domain-containing protein n=1 Tax=Mycolicibacter longobardus TaxID=1108812 RepID=A0A1X1YFU9_9MYCO|nr:hypothetical protein [Mycolicibacter longobardus]MCV7384732.1 hypothetical protein [Mycolicibacter longobardus]ORW09934.1 hypothetical protein AWC16_15565 [Mycolicibacter longobardus]